jgi:hypothetical protein
MSTASSAPIPAGWYPDPAGSFQQRWWTGEAWTNDFAQYRPTLVHAAAVPQFPSMVAQQEPADAEFLAQQAAATAAAQAAGSAATASGPTQTLTREPATTVDPLPTFRLPVADQAPQTTVAQPNAGNASLIAVAPTYRPAQRDTGFTGEYMPFGSQPEVRAGERILPERRYTISAWLMALLPLALVAAAWAVATFVPAIYTTFTQGALVVVFLIVSVVLAALDRRTLHLDGHDITTAPALALLTPFAFLPARAVIASRETGRSTFAPLLLLIVVAAAIAAALVFVDGLVSLLLTASALY